MQDLIASGMGANPRRKTSFTGANGTQTVGTMNPFGLTQNDPAMGYLGAGAPPAAPLAQPTPAPAPSVQPAPQAASAVPEPMGGMTYTKPPQKDLISLGMPSGGPTDQSADPYMTGITGMDGSSIGRKIMGQQPQSMDRPLAPITPQFSPTGAPSWGGPRLMTNRRRQYQPPPLSPVSQ